jgi:hypothetical protein
VPRFFLWRIVQTSVASKLGRDPDFASAKMKGVLGFLEIYKKQWDECITHPCLLLNFPNTGH